MTTLAAHPGIGVWWRQRWPALLLAASLALNLFFVAGAVWIRWHAPPSPAARFEQIAGALKLDAKQRAAFRGYVDGLRQRAEEMRLETGPIFTAAWTEMAKQNPDQARAVQLFDEAAQKRQAMMREVAAQTGAFLATLSPQQRTDFIRLWREQPIPWWRRPNERR